jgi:hypothetical protein
VQRCCLVNQDVQIAGKAIEEVTPAITEFAQVTGLTEPVRELAAWATEWIRYRRAPFQARLIMRAVEKIRETGLPAHAVSDRTLRAVLEDGALEDDPGIQEMWSGLLANEALNAPVPPVFLRIVSEIEPAEARAMDRLLPPGSRTVADDIQADEYGLLPRHVDNLVRLGVFEARPRYAEGDGLTFENVEKQFGQILGVTELGVAFLEACRTQVSCR